MGGVLGEAVQQPAPVELAGCVPHRVAQSACTVRVNHTSLPLYCQPLQPQSDPPAQDMQGLTRMYSSRGNEYDADLCCVLKIKSSKTTGLARPLRNSSGHDRHVVTSLLVEMSHLSLEPGR